MIMKKSDLKTGMIVEIRSGERALIVKDNCYNEDAVIFSDDDWTSLSGFNNDLIWHTSSDEQSNYAKTIDIMKVYKPDLPTGFLGRKSKHGVFTPIWERKEDTTPEYTIEELFEKIGCEFKIVK